MLHNTLHALADMGLGTGCPWLTQSLVSAAAYQGLLAHWLRNIDCHLTNPHKKSTDPRGNFQ